MAALTEMARSVLSVVPVQQTARTELRVQTDRGALSTLCPANQGGAFGPNIQLAIVAPM